MIDNLPAADKDADLKVIIETRLLRSKVVYDLKKIEIDMAEQNIKLANQTIDWVMDPGRHKVNSNNIESCLAMAGFSAMRSKLTEARINVSDLARDAQGISSRVDDKFSNNTSTVIEAAEYCNASGNRLATTSELFVWAYVNNFKLEGKKFFAADLVYPGDSNAELHAAINPEPSGKIAVPYVLKNLLPHFGTYNVLSQFEKHSISESLIVKASSICIKSDTHSLRKLHVSYAAFPANDVNTTVYVFKPKQESQTNMWEIAKQIFYNRYSVSGQTALRDDQTPREFGGLISAFLKTHRDYWKPEFKSRSMSPKFNRLQSGLAGVWELPFYSISNPTKK